MRLSPKVKVLEFLEIVGPPEFAGILVKGPYPPVRVGDQHVLMDDRNEPKLYDRRTDPNQKRDVFRENPDIARRLHRRLVAEMRAIDSPPDWITALDSQAAGSGVCC